PHRPGYPGRPGPSQLSRVGSIHHPGACGHIFGGEVHPGDPSARRPVLAMSATRSVAPTEGRRLRPLMATPLVTYAGLSLSLLSTPMLTQAVGADGRGVIAGSFVMLQIMTWVAF